MRLYTYYVHKWNSPVRISMLTSVLRACSLLLPVSSIEPLLPDREVVLSSDFARMSDLPALLRRCLRSPRSSDLYLLSNFLYSRCPVTCLEDVLCPSGESAKPAGGRTISSDTSGLKQQEGTHDRERRQTDGQIEIESREESTLHIPIIRLVFLVLRGFSFVRWENINKAM